MSEQYSPEAVDESTSRSVGGPKTEPERRAFREALLGWFDGHRRDLPWRGVDDPYAVWVSEVMLQQTRVETVVDYFEEWMETFPDVETLAESDVEEVLELWSGLGYYRRARFLHRAAGQIVEKFDGAIPEDIDELQQLPGVGPYTAGAVASIAFGRAEPLVDGNVMRVVSRLYGIRGKPKRSPANNTIWERVGQLVDSDRPGDFNQGLMELGSEICTTDNPKCLVCPVRDWCHGHNTGDPQQFPEVRDRPDQKPMRARSCVVVRDKGDGAEFLLRRRPEEGLLGGLWEFPSCEEEGKTWPETSRLEELLTAAGLDSAEQTVGLDRALGTVTHVFSHRRLKVRVHQLEFDSSTDWSQKNIGDSKWRWVEAEQLEDVASAALLGKIEKLWREKG